MAIASSFVKKGSNMVTVAAIVAMSLAQPSATWPRSQLIAAIIQVESSGNDRAIGDKGTAVGPLQIRPILVDDVNRIVGEKRFTLTDRTDRAKSIEMFRIYSRHYSFGKTDEVIARRWNGGPSGDRKSGTLKYWRKVQSALHPTEKQ